MGPILSQSKDVFQAEISSEAEDPQWSNPRELLPIRYPWTGFVCLFVYLCLFYLCSGVVKAERANYSFTVKLTGDLSNTVLIKSAYS